MSYSQVQEQLRSTVKELLEKNEVSQVIGWGAGRFEHRPPVFIKKAEDAEKLIWDEYCLNTLGKYLLNDRFPEGKIGICVRGCDSRAVVRLIHDKQVKRENVYLIGLPCPGQKTEDGQEPAKCAACERRNPVMYDVLLGEPVTETEKPERFDRVRELEAKSADEKYDYWSNIFTRCIRCYACRNVCPACSCKECFVDQYRVGWQGKQQDCAQNQFYGLTRAYHVADRCIECGECERVCPVGLPLMELNRKLILDINDLFGPHEAGIDMDWKDPLGDYRLGDPEEFM